MDGLETVVLTQRQQNRWFIDVMKEDLQKVGVVEEGVAAWSLTVVY